MKMSFQILVSFESLAVEHGGNRIMANTVSVGAVLGILGMKLDILNEIIRNAFAKKSDEVIKGNIKAAKAGHDYAENKCDKCSETFNMASGDDHPKMLIAGNDAIGLGAVASGLKFFSAYPMTPSTGIMNYIAAKEGEYGIIVEQAEDEIAAINMALGASFAGVRSMTGTSGGGFALMTEGISWGRPWQRCGPAHRRPFFGGVPRFYSGSHHSRSPGGRSHRAGNQRGSNYHRRGPKHPQCPVER
jgi:2-oxoglutarate ferredoxin oxidoreductase subunit alpha